MGHGLDQVARTAERQFGIGIERDHIFHLMHRCDIAFDEESGGLRGTQECIERFKFSPFALVAHPALFARVPGARPVKQQKRPAAVLHIRVVEPLYAVPGQCQKRGIARQSFHCGVLKIRKQTKRNIFRMVGKVEYFHFIEQPGDRTLARKHARDGNQGA